MHRRKDAKKEIFKKKTKDKKEIKLLLTDVNEIEDIKIRQVLKRTITLIK